MAVVLITRWRWANSALHPPASRQVYNSSMELSVNCLSCSSIIVYCFVVLLVTASEKDQSDYQEKLYWEKVTTSSEATWDLTALAKLIDLLCAVALSLITVSHDTGLVRVLLFAWFTARINSLSTVVFSLRGPLATYSCTREKDYKKIPLWWPTSFYSPLLPFRWLHDQIIHPSGFDWDEHIYLWWFISPPPLC